MAKLFILVSLFILSSIAFAKRDVDMKSFNKDLLQNMDAVLKENPQDYETRPIRKPASVTPEIEKEESIEEKNQKNINDIEEQSTGLNDW